MIFSEAVDAVARDHFLETMLIESKSVDDRLREDGRLAPLGCLPVKEASPGPREKEVCYRWLSSFAFAQDKPSPIESHTVLILAPERKDHTAVKPPNVGSTENEIRGLKAI